LISRAAAELTKIPAKVSKLAGGGPRKEWRVDFNGTLGDLELNAGRDPTDERQIFSDIRF